MQTISSTAEILAYKALNRSINKTWINWAVDMLTAGFDSEYLVELAGASVLDNQFEFQALANNVLNELNLDCTDKDKIIKNYACYLIKQALNESITPKKALSTLQQIYVELGYEAYLSDFYSLYFAVEDLAGGEMQWYWPSADRGNIDMIINNYFLKWLSDNRC